MQQGVLHDRRVTLSVGTPLEHLMPSLLSAAVKFYVPALLGVFAVSGAPAQTPMSTDNSPGWYRMHIGSFEITALSDGARDLPVDQLFPKVDTGRIRSLLARSFLASTVSLTVNAFLVNTGTRLVLIDAGTGTSQAFGPKLGQLLTNLRASGYSAEQVEEVYVTHMHTDHIGGLMRDGQPAFPKATIRADVREAGRYLSKAEMDAAPADEREDY
jgi:glyoxylase-like metal-dependent hydrolase (beta-lactamase superfamily II)